MKKLLLLLPLLALTLPETANSVTQYKDYNYSNSGVTLSMSDATGTVYRAGETIRFTARADRDAYLLVFDIDTDGFVHLLYPRDNESLRKFSAGDNLAIPSQADESLVVTGDTGMEFVFAIAVSDRDAISEREIDWLRYGEKQSPDQRLRIDGDPFLAANRVAARLVRGISYARDVSLAYTYFFVNKAVDYPRYLCEDCYENDKDPYEPDRPWVATSALDSGSGLRYPLAPAFQIASAAPQSTTREIGVSAPTTTSDGITNVYVSYYPVWGSSYYPGWRYNYYYGWPGYGWDYYPYYGSGWYFSIGFNWGWGWGWNWGWGYPGWGWGYGYCQPYYRYGCYYPSPYYYGGYYYSVARRTVRPSAPATRYRSTVRGTSSSVAYRSKATTGTRDLTAYRGKSNRTYTPRSSYKGHSAKSYSAYNRYKSGARSAYEPRRTTYGKNTYTPRTRGYSSNYYRPRSSRSYSLRDGYTRSRTFGNDFFGRSTKSRSSRTYKGGTTHFRSYGTPFGGRSSSHSFTKSRSSFSHSSGATRARSHSGGGSKSRGKGR